MTNEEFRSWLQGYFELADENAMLDLVQLQVIINHLNLAEAVEGALDQRNADMRTAINAFRHGGDITPDTLTDFTQYLRAHVLTT